MTLRTETTYRGYVLDDFQREAIEAIEENRSVLVSAPTGTGKTLVADYVIEKAHQDGLQAVYTAPIKALSNQKFKEFKAHLGEDNVGILTGDIVINQTAPILIMTTEIFRNLLHQDPERLADVSYVIFDEVHYIDDPHRGSVWEESLIFMPDSMRFLGLSATIPNVDELAAWIESIQGRPVEVITHDTRAVPLKHALFEASFGTCTYQQLMKRYKRYSRRTRTDETGRLIGLDFPKTTHLDLVDYLQPQYLPALYFTFSRRRCQIQAHELAETADFLTADEKTTVEAVIARQVDRYSGTGSERLDRWTPMWMRGVAFHHAGMLPLYKDIVEELFESRLLRVLYCTETFAVGLNFPCRSVCFDSVTKWDGVSFRALSNREYFQMAGRAGRRGIDEAGYVFTVVDFNYFRPQEFSTMQEDDVEPLQSRFSLTYNTVLNLVRNYDHDEIQKILQQNFATFQTKAERKRLQTRITRARKSAAEDRRRAKRVKRLTHELHELSPADRFVDEYNAKLHLLQALDYVRDGEPTARGEFASRINGNELLVTELFFRGVFHEWPMDELNALAASIGYEPRKNERPIRHRLFDVGTVRRTVALIQQMEELYLSAATVQYSDNVAPLAYRWSDGESFSELFKGSEMDEGDIVYAFRRAIDLLRQVRNASRTDDPALATRMRTCIEKMDRDEVSILL